VARDEKWGYLAVDDGDGFYWRSQIVDADK
jgi:hypothetical protein